MKKISITIGIPAFNEETNIKSLFLDLLKQKTDNFFIKKIILSSDGSTDKTVSIIKKINDERIKIIDNKNRLGQGERQNQIIKLTDTDILVLLNADIRITDNKFISKLIDPILKNNADLTSSKLTPVKPRSFFEKVLCISEEYKNSVFELKNEGNNLFTCHGATRAFTKRLYKELNFRRSVAEDAYTYFYTTSKGFKYEYSRFAIAYYALPSTLQDHTKRSLRYFNSTLLLKNEFSDSVIKKSYKLPLLSTLLLLIKFMLKHPIYISVYLAVLMFVKIKSIFTIKNNISDNWEISRSTKGVRI